MVSTTGHRQYVKSAHGQFCPAWFNYAGIFIKAVCIELSAGSAKFVAVDIPSYLQFNENDIISFTIWTPFGVSNARGIVRWISQETGDYCWGMEFFELDDDKADPLRRLLQSIDEEKPVAA